MSRSTWLTFFLIIAIILSIFGMSRLTKKRSASSQAPLEKKIDAFVKNGEFRTYTQEGKLHAQLKAPTMLHYEEENSSYLTNPDALIYTKKRIPWYIRSKFGKAREGIDWIYLWEDVVIHQPAVGSHPDTRITTSAATIYPNTETATTDRHATVVQGNTEVSGTGLRVDFNNQIIDILSQSEGYYQPEQT